MKFIRFIVRGIGWLVLAGLVYTFAMSTYVLSEEENPAHAAQMFSGFWLAAWYFTRHRTRIETLIKSNEEYAKFRMECIDKRITALTGNTLPPAPSSPPARNA